jgi:hypothetical protein
MGSNPFLIGLAADATLGADGVQSRPIAIFLHFVKVAARNFANVAPFPNRERLHVDLQCGARRHKDARGEFLVGEVSPAPVKFDGYDSFQNRCHQHDAGKFGHWVWRDNAN